MTYSESIYKPSKKKRMRRSKMVVQIRVDNESTRTLMGDL